MNPILLNRLSNRIIESIKADIPFANISSRHINKALSTRGGTLDLQDLGIHKMPIIDVPTAIQTVNCSWNRLQNLPDMEGLLNVQELNLSQNDLTAVPQSIKSMTKLRVLDLRSNKIRDLPSWLSELPDLGELKIADNPLDSIPSRSLWGILPGSGLSGTGHRMPKRKPWERVRPEFRQLVHELAKSHNISRSVNLYKGKFTRPLNVDRQLLLSNWRDNDRRTIALPHEVGKANLNLISVEGMMVDGLPDMSDSPVRHIRLEIEYLDMNIFTAPNLESLMIESTDPHTIDQIAESIMEHLNNTTIVRWVVPGLPIVQILSRDTSLELDVRRVGQGMSPDTMVTIRRIA